MMRALVSSLREAAAFRSELMKPSAAQRTAQGCAHCCAMSLSEFHIRKNDGISSICPFTLEDKECKAQSGQAVSPGVVQFKRSKPARLQSSALSSYASNLCASCSCRQENNKL